MPAMRKKIILAATSALAAAALVYGIWRGVERHRARVRIEARKSFFARFGISSDGTREFTPLPESLTHNAAATRLGEKLFSDKRLASNSYRTCGACHRLNEGGIDPGMPAGVLSRTVFNAVFADVFLHDGSVTGITALVRRMIEGGDFCAGGSISNVAARLAADEKTLRQFQFAYDDGVTPGNIVDALVQYERTLFTSGEVFDLWCAGHKDMFNAQQTRGFDVFRERRCTTCHYGPALGTLKVSDGRKVPCLRGISRRRVFLPNGDADLGAVAARMPGGMLEAEDRAALVAFLKTL